MKRWRLAVDDSVEAAARRDGEHRRSEAEERPAITTCDCVLVES